MTLDGGYIIWKGLEKMWVCEILGLTSEGGVVCVCVRACMVRGGVPVIYLMFWPGSFLT